MFVRGRVFMVPAMTWNCDTARARYNLDGWSDGYFDVGGNGHLLVRPRGMPGSPEIDLRELVDRMHTAGLTMPVLLRFTDILRCQVDRLHGAFADALRAALAEAPLEGRLYQHLGRIHKWQRRYDAFFCTCVARAHLEADGVHEENQAEIAGEVQDVLGDADLHGSTSSSKSP